MTIKRPTSRQPIPDNANLIFKGKLFDIYQWEQKLFNGTTATFEKLRRPDTAYVIPVTNDKKVVVSKQTQPGSSPYIGLLGGRLNPGEDAKEAAARELKEEAGIVSSTLDLWLSFQFLPKIDWAIYVFVAHDCDFTNSLYLDGGEDVELLYLDFDELFSLVADDSFGDVEIALNFLRIANSDDKINDARRVFRIGA